MSDNSAFRKSFAAVLARAGDKAALAVQLTALELGKSLVTRSPVDTGRFRANWQYGANTVNTDTSSPPDRSGNTAVMRMAALARAAELGQTIYLTNSLPYSRPLEYGHSKQAPGGMVRLTVVEYTKHLETVVRNMK